MTPWRTIRIGGLLLTMAVSAGAAQLGPWRAIGPGGGWVRRILVDPTTPGRVYTDGYRAVTVGDVSGDSGATWVAMGSPPFLVDVALDPSAPGTLYASADSSPVQHPHHQADSRQKQRRRRIVARGLRARVPAYSPL